MKKYKEFIPQSPTEVKVTHDIKLGLLAEKLWSLLKDDGLIDDDGTPEHRFKDTDGNFILFRSDEYSPKELNQEKKLSEHTRKFLDEEFYKYLEVSHSGALKADWLKPVSDNQRDLLHTKSRIPGLYPSRDISDIIFWQSGIFHMDYGFDLDEYKFIIYVNDVEKNEGGVTFTNPLITPYLENGTPRWEGIQENLKLNVEPKTTEEITIDEKTGKKGTVVCFNCHIAHSARFPKNNYRKAIHLVFKGPKAKDYDRIPQPIKIEINKEYEIGK